MSYGYEPPQNVVVIGGGIVGSSIAWHLSQSHATNTTIIAGKVGGVATPNSFAWVNAGSTDKQFYYDFRYRSMNHWHEIEKAVPGLDEYIHWGASLNWDITNETERAAYGEKLKKWGYDVVTVNQTEIESTYEPQFDESFLPSWALRYTEEGQMEAHIVAERLVEQAQANGAALIETNVTSFLNKDGRISGVKLESGEEVQADHVVLAAGLGSVDLLAGEGVNLRKSTGHPISETSKLIIHSFDTRSRSPYQHCTHFYETPQRRRLLY